MTTRVFILPAVLRDAGNAMAETLGWGSPVFVQPLSATGQEPITHWGFPAVVNGEFIAMWDNPPEEAAQLVASVQIDTRDGDDTAGHWRDVIEGIGLRSVALAEDIIVNNK